MSTWMLYSVVVASLIGLAALALERAALASGRSTRWVWLVAMTSSAVLPMVLPRIADRGVDGLATVGAIEVVGFDAAVPTAVAGGGVPLDQLLLAGWVVASVVLLALFAASVAVLNHRRRAWRHRVVGGAAVLVSEQTGPALVGFLAPELVFPAWLLDLDERSLDLLIAHEWEHRREGDPLLLLAAIGALIIFPWNLALWWQVRRLRLAIEVDCDARVLRRHRDPRRYGLLLLEVGRRATRAALPAAAFIHPTSFLERRMRVLVKTSGLSRSTGLIAVLLALVPPAVLFAIPKPDLPVLTIALPSAPAQPDPVTPGGPQGMSGSPMTPPQEQGALTPMEGEDAEPEQGVDSAEQDATRSRGIAVWTRPGVPLQPGRIAGTIPVSQRKRTGEAVVPARKSDVRPDTVPEPVSARPTFTPYEERPVLRDREEFARTLQQHYPASLKEQGIEGTTVLWVFIDEAGEVGRTMVTQSSGHALLDEAAMQAMQTARFTPARNREQPVSVWIMLPITFQTER